MEQFTFVHAKLGLYGQTGQWKIIQEAWENHA